MVSRDDQAARLALGQLQDYDKLGEQEGHGEQPVDVSVALVEGLSVLDVVTAGVTECVFP